MHGPGSGVREVPRCSRLSAPALPPRSSPSSTFTAFAADKPFQRSDLADSAVRLETQIKTEVRTGRKARRDAAQRGGGRLRQARFPRRHADAGADRLGRAARSRQLAAPFARHPANPRRTTTASASTSSSAPQPPPTSRISAPAMPARRPTRWCCSAAPSPSASCGARRSTPTALRSICVKSRTCGQTYE